MKHFYRGENVSILNVEIQYGKMRFSQILIIKLIKQN